MKSWIVFIALLIGIGIGIAYEKSKPTPNTLYVRVGGPGQQALLNPQVGDIVVLRTPAFAPGATGASGLKTVPPLWKFGLSPCDPAYPDECHVLKSANGKKFRYKCPTDSPCDPDVPIGSDVGSFQVPTTHAANVFTPYHVIDIACDATTTPPNGINVSESPAPVSKTLESGAFWEMIDTLTPQWSVGNWKDAAGNSATVCNEGTIDQDHPMCTLAASAAAGNVYSYTATASACATPSGVFKLQVH